MAPGMPGCIEWPERAMADDRERKKAVASGQTTPAAHFDNMRL
jgi:hypothetical protein